MPVDAQKLHNESLAFLEDAFAEPFDGPTVVVTHHAPSRLSIHKDFGGDRLNAAFASELDSLIARWQPHLWIHGHVHRSCDYSTGKTRVVCNPRGYDGGDKGPENKGSNMFKIVEVPRRDALDRLANMAAKLEAIHGIHDDDFEGGLADKLT